jgi:tetratricopeptide (TPR) repeat protein
LAVGVAVVVSSDGAPFLGYDPIITMVRSSLRQSSKEESTNKEEQNVIVKTSLIGIYKFLFPPLSRRRLGSFRRRSIGQSQLSSATAIRTVCSIDDHDTCHSVEAEEGLAQTLSTRTGTEAFLFPREEARYFVDQGLEHRAQGRHQDALESLTQALSLSHGSDLQPRILWTLISLYVDELQVDKDATCNQAVEYLSILEPRICDLEDEWIEQEASLPLLNFLQEQRQWSIALRMVRIVKPEHDALARIYFETAVSQSSDQAMPRLKDALYFCRDNTLKQSILHTMVHAHAAQNEWEEALSCQSCYMDFLHAEEDLVQAHADAAELHLSKKDYPAALASLEEGLKIETTTPLLQAKAHILYYHLNQTNEALAIYQSLLSRVCPADASRIYYTMGRICCKTGRYEEALECFLSELKITKSTLGEYNIEVSRILHDVARIYEDSLGDYEEALKYYKKALKVERHAAKLAPQLSAQVLETQRCMGRIHYKRGEFDKAVTVSFADDLSAATM